MKEFMLFACGFGFGLALLALPIVALSFIFPAFWMFAVGLGLGALGVLLMAVGLVLKLGSVIFRA